MTLKDIAEKAGVSMMTVSNVINKKTNRVSPQTAARDLSEHPPVCGRGLHSEDICTVRAGRPDAEPVPGREK